MKISVDNSWLQSNGKYKCPHCSKEFSKKGISTHIWRMHTKEGKNFSENRPNYFKGKEDITAQQVWSKDKERNDFLKSKNIDVIIVWENEYASNKENVINKCVDEILKKYEKL